MGLLLLQAHASGDQIVLPLTLEMSFWLWVRENLGQLFSGLGMFNLKLPNRLQPVLRRHLAWFEFLTQRGWRPLLLELLDTEQPRLSTATHG